MAAGALNYGAVLDDELAFNLQIEEAMAASLALLPSTSHSPPPSSSSLPSRFLVDHRPDRKNPDVIWISDNDALDKEVHLDRRLRNLVAGETITISDDEREEDVPGVGLSRNTFSRTERCRLYFKGKGLSGEESVGDAMVIVAAIFDARDNLLSEVSKPLEAIRESKGPSLKIAGLGALIEGLEAALALPLERVSFFCDDRTIYQYVTGKVQPKVSEVVSLVEKVTRLRGNFTYCEPILAAKDDVKVAFKSAKDAIASQVRLPAAEKGKRRKLLENCRICFEDTELCHMFTVDGCLHRYCSSCMKHHMEVKFLAGSEAKCPHEGCESTLSIESCSKLLPPEVIEIIIQRLKESSIPVSEKVYCPHPKCSALMSKSEVLKYTKDALGNAKQSGARKCMKCHRLFCIRCKTSWHNGMNCKDYQRSSHNSQTEDAKLKSLATKKLWRPCARCSHLVELAEGCYHITCRCGYEFCYTCGAEWKNKKPTCSCPIWHEHNIIRNG